MTSEETARLFHDALSKIADAQVAFDAHPVGVIETMRGWAREALKVSLSYDKEMDWLRGDWFEAYEDCVSAIDEGGVSLEDLERLKGRVDQTIRAALAEARQRDQL